jgi:hypothetical protein
VFSITTPPRTTVTAPGEHELGAITTGSITESVS